MKQIIEDAGMDVVKNVEKFNKADLTLFTAQYPITSAGIVNETSIVDFVERNNKTCIEIPASMKNMAVDDTSLNYATPEYPVFYKENGRIYVLPEPEERTLTSFETSVCLFSKGEIVAGDYSYYSTDVTFIKNSYNLTDAIATNDFSTLESNKVSHNLQTGDYLQILQSEDYYLSIWFSTFDSGFGPLGVNPSPMLVKRIDAHTLRFIGLPWPGITTESNWSTDANDYPGYETFTITDLSDESITYHKFAGYRPIYAGSIAHIVQKTTTRGHETSEGVYYNNEDEVITIDNPNWMPSSDAYYVG